ncbi:MAG TPA: protein-L-isoaspartate O-methyltransferase [Rhizomicrobium sp.]|jgi:protein-L-isoaspartate(D-aspartate) O-methyltransferase|nr:protein-L-isoaspartate O-methyltransferase [Rhizomicrobium sp.]
MPDFAAQRFNMVESQVRANDVTDDAVLAALHEIPRERFVPNAKRALAYADAVVEVSPGRFLLDPRSFAKLLQLAQVEPGDKILDVGCATGYSSAVLSRLGRSVTALEQDADLVRVASEALPSVGASNATVVQGALADGFKAKAPYNVIFVNGSIEAEPKALLAQLGEGGRLVAVLQTKQPGVATLFLKENGHAGARPAFDATVPALAGFRQPVGFVF